MERAACSVPRPGASRGVPPKPRAAQRRRLVTRAATDAGAQKKARQLSPRGVTEWQRSDGFSR